MMRAAKGLGRSTVIAGVLGLSGVCLLPSQAPAQGLQPPPPQSSPPSPPSAPAPSVAPGLQGAPLAPPPPTAAPNPNATLEAETLRQLERAEREDSGRGLQYFFVEPEVGYQWVSPAAFSNKKLFEGDAKSSSGLSFGGTAAIRLLYWTLGARFRMGLLQDYRLWSVGGEAGFRIPYGRLEPYATLGVGYVRMDNFKDEEAILSLGTAVGDLRLGGLDARLGAGVDYFVTPVFSVGLLVDAELLVLSRDVVLQGSNTAFDQSGSGLGIAVTPSAVLGLHY